MYYDFFGFKEPPFSIAPDPRYLYLSERHKEALAHLMYGVQGQGGFIVITGEVGTGKTTVSRCFLENVPAHVDMALILNPRLSARELLSAICDELKIDHPQRASIKELVALINDDLLQAHGAGRHKVLMIDEAQNLSADVLEQLRLLTNLETTEKKLLQIVLLGQPELQDMLALPQLRQLNQRVTARYHLEGLEPGEIQAYVRYRLEVAGLKGEVFSDGAIKALYRHSQGIPRLINLISDRALLGAYAEGEHHINSAYIRKAAAEVNGRGAIGSGFWSRRLPQFAGAVVIAVLAIVLAVQWSNNQAPEPNGSQAAETVTDQNFIGKVERVAADPPEQSGPEEFSFEDRLESLPEAFVALFDVWGREYQVSQSPTACEFARQQGLECLETRMSRQGLLFLNRPSILYLRNQAGETGYILLKSLNDGRAEITGTNGDSTVTFDSIEKVWRGRFTLLWEPPEDQTPADRQVWLSARMMELSSQQSETREEEDRVVRMSSDQQIRWYQSKKGLTVDGIAGAMTVIQMNNDLNAPVPRLHAEGGAE